MQGNYEDRAARLYTTIRDFPNPSAADIAELSARLVKVATEVHRAVVSKMAKDPDYAGRKYGHIAAIANDARMGAVQAKHLAQRGDANAGFDKLKYHALVLWRGGELITRNMKGITVMRTMKNATANFATRIVQFSEKYGNLTTGEVRNRRPRLIQAARILLKECKSRFGELPEDYGWMAEEAAANIEKYINMVDNGYEGMWNRIPGEFRRMVLPFGILAQRRNADENRLAGRRPVKGTSSDLLNRLTYISNVWGGKYVRNESPTLAEITQAYKQLIGFGQEISALLVHMPKYGNSYDQRIPDKVRKALYNARDGVIRAKEGDMKRAVGAIYLGIERLVYVAKFMGETRLRPDAFKPNPKR